MKWEDQYGLTELLHSRRKWPCVIPPWGRSQGCFIRQQERLPLASFAPTLDRLSRINQADLIPGALSGPDPRKNRHLVEAYGEIPQLRTAGQSLSDSGWQPRMTFADLGGPMPRLCLASCVGPSSHSSMAWRHFPSITLRRTFKIYRQVADSGGISINSTLTETLRLPCWTPPPARHSRLSGHENGGPSTFIGNAEKRASGWSTLIKGRSPVP